MKFSDKTIKQIEQLSKDLATYKNISTEEAMKIIYGEKNIKKVENIILDTCNIFKNVL